METLQINAAEFYTELQTEASKAIVGQETAFELAVVALLTGGHVLIEGVPGTAKTLLAKTIAHLISASFRRIQFTADLMPSDIVGTQVFEMNQARFYLKRGPIFANIVLGDEINRAPAKTQSALLEAMEERQVTIDGEPHPLNAPFMVLATQNPIEYEGTYPLPEAQLDRFLFKILMDYPTAETEQEVLRRYHHGFDAHNLVEIDAVADPESLSQIRQTIQTVTVEEGVFRYIIAISRASRNSPDLLLGGSPRASIALLMACKTLAALRGREYVTPDDVKYLVLPVFRHRIILRPEAEIEGLDADSVMQRILSTIDVPR